LSSFASLLETELAALFGARVALEEAFALQGDAEILVMLDERARDRMTHSLSLAIDPSAAHNSGNRKLGRELALKKRFLKYSLTSLPLIVTEVRVPGVRRTRALAVFLRPIVSMYLSEVLVAISFYSISLS
jgi:hypothetical protein